MFGLEPLNFFPSFVCDLTALLVARVSIHLGPRFIDEVAAAANARHHHEAQSEGVAEKD